MTDLRSVPLANYQIFEYDLHAFSSQNIPIAGFRYLSIYLSGFVNPYWPIENPDINYRLRLVIDNRLNIPIIGDMKNISLVGMQAMTIENPAMNATYNNAIGTMYVILSEEPVYFEVPFKELPSYNGEIILGPGAGADVWMGELAPVAGFTEILCHYLPRSIEKMTYLFWVKSGVVAGKEWRFYSDNNEYKNLDLELDVIRSIDLATSRLRFSIIGDGDVGVTIEYQIRFFHYG